MSAPVRAPLGHLKIADNAVKASYDYILDTDREKQRAGRAVAEVIALWPHWIELKLAEMARWEANWDRQKAPSFSCETIQSANQLVREIRRLFPEDGRAGVPVLVPLQDGSIRFELRTGQKELFLTALGTAVEVQKWFPLDNVHSIDYAEVPVGDVGPALEWLTTT